jgi:hypothetical protein
MPAGARQIFETGNEPEYYVEEIARVEPLGGGIVRLYVASERQGSLRVEYTVIMRMDRLADIGRVCMAIATEPNSDVPWLQPEVAH